MVVAVIGVAALIAGYLMASSRRDTRSGTRGDKRVSSNNSGTYYGAGGYMMASDSGGRDGRGTDGPDGGGSIGPTPDAGSGGGGGDSGGGGGDGGGGSS